MEIESEEKLWFRDEKNIFWFKYPKNITIWNIVPIISSIIQDYLSHKESIPDFLVMVDASSVETYDTSALQISIGKVQEYMGGVVAVYNMSENYKEIITNYYKNNSKPSNIQHFEMKDEALTWLLSQAKSNNLNLEPN